MFRWREPRTPSSNVTVPVGVPAALATVAMKVTLWPKTLDELPL